MVDFDVSIIDLAVVVLYNVHSRAIVIWLTRGSGESSSGFFLGGKSFLWPMIGFATNVSGGSFVGLAGAGYSGGIAVYS